MLEIQNTLPRLQLSCALEALQTFVQSTSSENITLRINLEKAEVVWIGEHEVDLRVVVGGKHVDSVVQLSV